MTFAVLLMVKSNKPCIPFPVMTRRRYDVSDFSIPQYSTGTRAIGCSNMTHDRFEEANE